MEKHVLIVEDEILVGMMLARQIKGYGYNVYDVVSTGEEAITVASGMGRGVVLMDVSLAGDFDGVEAAAVLHRNYALPIIFFTGYSQDSLLLRRAAEIQPVAILNKLGAMEEMKAALDKAFAGTRSE
jgi:two-component system, response regulator PdtaR